MQRANPTLLPIAALLLACDPEPGPPPAVERFDSAGVEIVVNHVPAWGPGDAWTVSEEPAVVIGAQDGPEEYVLRGPQHVRRLSDGSILIADGGRLPDLLVYDAGGRFIRRIGRGGEGPGEFMAIGDLQVLPDGRVLVYDVTQKRLKFFTGDGSLIRETPVVPSPAPVDLVYQEWWGDRAIYLVLGAITQRTLDGARMESIEVHLVRLGDDRRELDTIVSYAGQERRAPQGSVPGSGPITPMARSGAVEYGDDILAVGHPAPLDIRILTVDGDLVRRIRAPVLDRPVTQAFKDSISDARRQGLLEFGWDEIEEELWNRVPVPPTWPAFRDLLIDDAGNLWLRPRHPDFMPLPLPETFHVFAPSGRLLGAVEMPAGVYPVEIGEEHLISIGADEIGVPHVSLHTLGKPGR